MSNHTALKQAAILIASVLLTGSPALAGPNDFFGSGIPVGGPGAIGSIPDDEPGAKNGSNSSGQSIINGQPGPSSSPTDFTDDEKRMRKKFKSRMANDQGLINKGEAMMKRAPNKSDKDYKKGKILKEIGEKDLAECQANDPLKDTDVDEKPSKKKGKKDDNVKDSAKDSSKDSDKDK